MVPQRESPCLYVDYPSGNNAATAIDTERRGRIMDVKFSNVRDLWAPKLDKYQHRDGTTRHQQRICFKDTSGNITWVVFESDNKISLEHTQSVEISVR